MDKKEDKAKDSITLQGNTITSLEYDPNIVLLSLGELAEKNTVISGEPIFARSVMLLYLD